MTCPNADILTRFADATLADHEAAEVVAHLAVCEACSRKVENLEHRPEEPMMAALRDLKSVPTETDDPTLPRKIAQYVILEKIGSGGMGVVYRAVHPHLKREVALKVIRDTRLDDPMARERFVQEMHSLGKLTHPNIVHASDAGLDGNTPYIVMEMLDGEDLGTWIDRHGKMSVKLAVDCIRQAATGLAYAHKAGYVHRDIKPSNLFLLRDGVVKILDLGIARPMADSAGEGQTVTGHVVGSPEFMAPELLRGGAADVRSDIYSLGQTFACLLTGQVQAGNSEPIPSKLKPILARMTAGLPEQRYQTADELIRALDAATKSSYIKFWMAAILAVILSTLGFMLLPSTKVPVVEPPQPPATTVTETKTKTPVKSSPVADWKTELHQNDFLPPPFDITSPTGWDGFFEAVVNCYYANRDDHAFGVMFTPFRSLHQMGRGSDAERLVALQLSRPLSGNAIKQAEKRIGDLAIAANWEDTLGNKEKSEEYHARIQELIAAETSDLNRDRLNLYYEGRKKVRWRQFTVPKELVEAIDEGESSVKDLCDQGRYQDAIRRYLTAVHDSSVARDPEVRLLYNGYGESYVLSRMIEKGDLDGAEKLRREVDCAESMYFRMGCFLTLGYLKTGRKDEAQAAWNASIEKLTRRMNQQPSLVEKFEFLNTLLESVADTGLYEYVRTESRK